MVEDTQTNTGNSIANISDKTKQPKEINGAEILDEPIVQRATELFEATKRTVQSKV
jgi:DNA polymerase-3 subunit gamma/tau